MVHILDSFDKPPSKGRFVQLNCGIYALNSSNRQITGPIPPIGRETCEKCLRKHNTAVSYPNMEKPGFVLMLEL